MSQIARHAEDRVLRRNVSWGLVALAESEDREPPGRLAYDEGTLEVTTPHQPHERIAERSYREVSANAVLPLLSASKMEELIARRHDVDETTLPQEFLAWIESDVKPQA